MHMKRMISVSPGLLHLPAYSLVQLSCSVMSNALWPHGLQHARLPCPSPTPGACSNSYTSSWWCHPTISSSVISFSRLQSFPASGSFQMSQFFKSGGQSIGVSASASVLPMNISNIYFSYEIQSLLHLLLEECVNDSLYSSVKQLGKFNKNIDLLLA